MTKRTAISRRHRPSGFTLVETLVAGSVLVVSLTGVTLMSMSAAQNNARASAGVEAGRIGFDVLNQYKMLGIENLLGLYTAAPIEVVGTVPKRRLFPTAADLAAGKKLTDPAGREVDVRVYATDVSQSLGGAAVKLEAVLKWEERFSPNPTSSSAKPREQTYEAIVSANL